MAATGMACQDRGGVDGETRGDVAATRPAARSSTCSTDVAHDAASESAADEPPAGYDYKGLAVRCAKTAATFATITLLWSLWNSPSLAAWFDLLARGLRAS